MFRRLQHKLWFCLLHTTMRATGWTVTCRRLVMSAHPCPERSLTLKAPANPAAVGRGWKGCRNTITKEAVRFADGQQRTRCSMLAHLNPRISHVPGFLISFVLKVGNPAHI